MHASLPDNAFVLFRDGDVWFCVGVEFVNIQESPSGYGDSIQDAIIHYQSELIKSFQIGKSYAR